MAVVKTVCTYCGTGCEIAATVENNTILAIEGDQDGEVSRGKLCVKGRYGFDFVASPARVKRPRIKKLFIAHNRSQMPEILQKRLFLLSEIDNDFFECDLDIALDIAAWKTEDILQRYGSGSFGFIGGARGNCESAYIFQKFAREIIGTPNVDNCARVCHAPSLAGLSRTIGLGAATNPFSDIYEAELIVVIGSNTTEAHPIVGLKILEAAKNGCKLAVIDTRRIMLGKNADLEILIGFDSNLKTLNYIAKYIVENRLYNQQFLSERTENYERYFQQITDDHNAIDDNLAKLLNSLAELIAAKKTLFCWGLGVTEHIDGSDCVSAISNIALLTGNVGKIGAGLMPLRGQNNVQGACDMGVLPYYETGYKQPKTVGLMTPQMITAAQNGTIKAIFNMGEDIVHTHSNQTKIAAAVDQLEFLCVNDLFMSQTAQKADIVFGVASAYEKSGIYINAERRLHIAAPLIRSELLDDWQIFAALSKRLNKPISLNNYEEIWREIQAKAPQMFGSKPYADMQNRQWSSDHSFAARLHTESFATPSGKATLFFAPSRACAECAENTFQLTTGRALEIYNNGAQTNESARLTRKISEDAVLIAPNDAAKLDLNRRYALISRYGSSSPLALKSSPNIAVGTLFCTFHFARSRINRLFGDECDSQTMTPNFKSIRVQLEPR
ncbi:formate dehydrogenase subunit alpha [Campylobacterota bacterium]|nr:formate dehydrogenase subunit alpha [Campylobacterota bacterium]